MSQICVGVPPCHRNPRGPLTPSRRQEDEERRKARRKKKGRLRELEDIRSELAEKGLVLLEKEQELLEKEQTLAVLREEVRLRRAAGGCGRDVVHSRQLLF